MDAGWCLYKDERGDSVVFDAMGPGCLRSFWQTWIQKDQILKFYFDGEPRLRHTIPALDLYRGKHPLFPAPLVSYQRLGYWGDNPRAGNCFVPIPFAKSLTISIQGKPTFHHFIYEQYPYGTPVTTFTGKEDREYLLQAFARQGEELQPPAAAEVLRAATDTLSPAGRLDLLNVQKPGVVARVVIEGDASDDFLRQTEIEMQWDESLRPDVLAPVGMFFAVGSQAGDVRSLPVKVEMLPHDRLRLTSYFRMPFWHKGHIALVNRLAKSTGRIAAEVHLAPHRYAENEAGYFCALYRDGRTDMGRDWLFCDALGTGWFLVQSRRCKVRTIARATSDSRSTARECPRSSAPGPRITIWPAFGPIGFSTSPSPAVRPTSSRRSRMEGSSLSNHIRPATTASIWTAPIPFYRSLDARIQHGGRSDIVSHYRSLGFYYLRKRPALRQTDFIDVASPASEKAHAYRATASKPTGGLAAAYEGSADETLVRDRGRRHAGGEISFTVAIDPNNDGVRLVRRLDQGGPRQAADVYVDGRPAGTWYHPDQNTFLRWFDSEFDLPGDLTRGKSELKIRLAVRNGPGYGDFTDFRYDVLVFEGRQ